MRITGMRITGVEDTDQFAESLAELTELTGLEHALREASQPVVSSAPRRATDRRMTGRNAASPTPQTRRYRPVRLIFKRGLTLR